MVYQIVASVCQHPIRTSSHLPWSGSTLDFDVRYCSDCESSRGIRQERDDAERRYRSEYDRIGGDRRRRDSGYRESRRTYDDTRRRYADDVDSQQDREDRDRRARGQPTVREAGRRFAGLDSPAYVALQNAFGRGRSVRIAEPQPHRRESQYRDQGNYRRSSTAYAPGRHSDRSGYGYYNTNDPYANENYEDAELDALSRDALDSRRRRLEEQLSRYR